MTWDLWIGLLGTAASLAALAWKKQDVTKLTLILLALLGSTLVVKSVLYERELHRVQTQILDTLGTAYMSADQLYGSIDTKAVTRQLFEDALSQTEEDRRLTHRDLELLADDGVYVRVRVYFTRDTAAQQGAPPDPHASASLRREGG